MTPLGVEAMMPTRHTLTCVCMHVCVWAPLGIQVCVLMCMYVWGSQRATSLIVTQVQYSWVLRQSLTELSLASTQSVCEDDLTS